jgi:hypothetical protein
MKTLKTLGIISGLIPTESAFEYAQTQQTSSSKTAWKPGQTFKECRNRHEMVVGPGRRVHDGIARG